MPTGLGADRAGCRPGQSQLTAGSVALEVDEGTLRTSESPTPRLLCRARDSLDPHAWIDKRWI